MNIKQEHDTRIELGVTCHLIVVVFTGHDMLWSSWVQVHHLVWIQVGSS